MADVIRKRVTLHPLKKNGQMDLNVNLYPKCFVDGIVDRNGNVVNVVTSNSSEPINIDEKFAELQDEIDAKGDVTSEELAQAVANKAEITLIELNDLMSEETIASMGAFLIGWTELTHNAWYFSDEIDLSELKDETFIGFHYLLHGDDESVISDTLLLFTKEHCTNDEPVFVLNRLSPTIDVSHLSLTLTSTGIIGVLQFNTEAAPHWGDIAGNIQEQTDLQAALVNKQDIIVDLDDIRTGAAAGATSVQPSTLDNYATLNDISDLVDEEQVEDIVETAFEEMLEDDTYFATADDIYAAYHILNIENQEIEENTMVLSEDDFVDEEEHLADLDVVHIIEPLA